MGKETMNAKKVACHGKKASRFFIVLEEIWLSKLVLKKNGKGDI
jgi:hypothetical protein